MYEVEEKYVQRFGGKTDKKRPLGRPKYRQEKNIETDLKERRWGCADWMDLVQYKVTLWAIVNAIL